MGGAAALLCFVLALRVFSPGVADAMRATVLPMMEAELDYRGTIAAIGEMLTGDRDILEALGEIAVLAFGGVSPMDVEVTATPDEPEIEPLPLFLPVAIYPPIETVFPVPTFPPPSVVEPEEQLEAVTVFLARQESFSGHTLPANAAVGYEALGLDFVAPVSGRVSSPFGFRWHPLHQDVRFHFGTDIAADTGTPILAVADGRVVSARYGMGFGKYILLYHGSGTYTRYAHASALYVQTGDVVEQGRMIGRVGATGGATGPHLHFELRATGLYRNPEFYLDFG